MTDHCQAEFDIFKTILFDLPTSNNFVLSAEPISVALLATTSFTISSFPISET